MVDFYEMVDRWAQWAVGVVQEWPDDPSEAEPNLDLDRHILEQAAKRQRRPNADSAAVEGKGVADQQPRV
jgi:PadR family transcriptional regulator AphA